MAGRSAVFFDLDGTLGTETADTASGFSDFFWYDNAAEAVALINAAGFLAISITNQAPIARGLFTLQDFWLRMTELESELSDNGARLDAVFCCPHDIEDHCSCKKPHAGLIDAACERFPDIDLTRSYVIGDTGATDILLARAIACRAVLVRTGRGEGSLAEYRSLWSETEADYIAVDALDAVHWILADST